MYLTSSSKSCGKGHFHGKCYCSIGMHIHTVQLQLYYINIFLFHLLYEQWIFIYLWLVKYGHLWYEVIRVQHCIGIISTFLCAFVHVFISAHFMCISMEAWECLCLCLHRQPIWPYDAAFHWHVVDDRPALMGMVISQVDLGIPWGMGSVWLSQDITRRHILLHTLHKPMKMITFDTQMTFFPCCDNTGSFFCSDIRCCVGVIRVKSIILMEK